MTNRRPFALLCGAAFTVFMFPQSASAATDAPPPPADVASSDILVTARRVEERLQSVPISISVFNQQQLNDRNIVSPQDLANYTPSLSINTGYFGDNTAYALRGFVQDYGTAPSVGVYFADVVAPRGSGGQVPVGDGAGPGDFFDLQNVQVLKGPQGTLFGRNTTGGAILFVPQKPTSKLEGYVEGSYGNYDMHRVQAAFNTPLGDKARFRIAIDHQDRDGYQHNLSGIGPNDFANVNYTAVRASMIVDLTPDLETYVIASFLDSKNNGSVQKLIACAPTLGFGPSLACPQLAAERAKGAGFYDIESQVPNPESSLRQFQFIDTTTWRATDNLTVKNIISYAQARDIYRNAIYGTGFLVNGQPLPYVVFGNAPGLPSSDQSTFTEELQVQGHSSNERLTYQAGVYAEVSNPLGRSGLQSSSLLSCTNIAALQCTDYLGIGASQATGFKTAIHYGSVSNSIGATFYRDYGAYGQASYRLTDKIKLTGGIRYTWDEQRNTTTAIAYRFPVLPPFTGAPTASCVNLGQPNCTVALSNRSSAPTWLIDLDYTPTKDVLLYAKYSRGYRSGGVFPGAPTDYNTFRPERVDTYEGGFKTSFHGAVHGTFNVSAFYNDFSNQQLRVIFTAAPGAPVSSGTGIVNAGKSRIWGVEAETSISPFRNFTIDANYTYLNTKILKTVPFAVNDPNYIINYQIPIGSPLTLSPKNKLTASASYAIPLGEMGRITVAATYTFVDKQIATYTFANNTLATAFSHNYTYLPSFDLLNLNLNWTNIASSGVDASIFAANALNKKYYTYFGAGGAQGLQTATLGQPRMYGVRLRYRFGG
jgi:iron complex outermembrane receptor protein